MKKLFLLLLLIVGVSGEEELSFNKTNAEWGEEYAAVRTVCVPCNMAIFCSEFKSRKRCDMRNKCKWDKQRDKCFPNCQYFNRYMALDVGGFLVSNHSGNATST